MDTISTTVFHGNFG